MAGSRGSPWTTARAFWPDRREELAGDRFLHQDAEGAQADLAGIVELLDRQAHRQVEVGVGEDEQRGLAAQLERHRDDVGCGRGRDEPGRGHRPGKGHPADARVRAQRGARLGPEPLHDVEDPGRQACLAP